MLVDYDYSLDLDKSRQTSKPYPSTPDIWPRDQDKNEEVPIDDAAEMPTDECLTSADIELQQKIMEEHNLKSKIILETYGQRTVRLFLSVSYIY